MATAMRAADGDRDMSLAWLRDKRVLLAEDNITNQMVATQMLDALGAEVDVANDGAEAVEMLELRGYDVYLIDIEMPRVSGLDVIRAIRAAEPPLCDAPVIAVTAYALREHREKIAEAGADGLIPKPLIGIEQFGRDIMSHIDRARRRSADGAPEAAARPEAQRADGPAPVAPDAPVSQAVFEALADAVGADEMGDLLVKIEGDLGRAEADVARGVADRDNAALSGATHVLISVAGAVGAQKLQKLAQRLNGVANGRNDEALAPLADELGAEIRALRSFVAGRIRG